MSSETIEDIILSDDQRGISALRPYLPADFCTGAVQFILDRPGPALVATGFYILSGNAVETDGPPGALAIGRALEALGCTVAYVTDAHGAAVMQAVAGERADVIEFPIAGRDESEAFARDLLDRYRPSLVIGIERCAPSGDGLYRNMRGVDITPYTARLDMLFDLHGATVGIGDGGNELGMGNLADRIAGLPKLPPEPAVTQCSKLVIASISNWGGYGLVAALSQLTGRDLLPTLEEEAAWVQRCVEAGAVDGFSGERSLKVDGTDVTRYQLALARLRELVN